MIAIADEFSHDLMFRFKKQDKKFSAEAFREQFLSALNAQEWWANSNSKIIINFENVDTLTPSWANEAFAYYTKSLANPSQIKERIDFQNLSTIKRQIIEREIQRGYENN